MKKEFLLILSLLFLGSVRLGAQQPLKIKVKKGNILVNDVLWGHCESKGSFFKGYTYKFTNIEGTLLLTVSFLQMKICKWLQIELKSIFYAH